MTNDDVQKIARKGVDMTFASFGAWAKGTQAIAVEAIDYSKKSAEGSAAAWEKLLGVKSLEKAVEVQADYWKSSYEDLVAETAKLSGLCLDVAKEAYRPFDGAFAKAATAK